MGPSGDAMNSLVYLTWSSELHPHFVVMTSHMIKKVTSSKFHEL